MNIKDAESAVQIDPLKLDLECITLPSQVLKWSVACAESRSKMDEEKAQLEITTADADKVIRADPGHFGLDKVTEAGIKSAIAVHKEVKKAQDRLLDAKNEYDLLCAVVNALDTKKRTLTLLVDLHGMGYFSGVKLSAEGQEAVDRMTQTAVRGNRVRRGE